MKQAFAASNENTQLLADRIEISNLLLDLATAIDTNDRAALGHMFAVDVTIEQSSLDTMKGQHQISNADVHIDGDTAVARTLCHSADQPSSEAIYYVAKLRRTAEGWRILAQILAMERE